MIDDAGEPLAVVEECLGDCNPPLAEVRLGLDAARTELREPALGIYSAALTEAGLRDALTELAVRFPVPTTVVVPSTRWPPAVEAAAYFTGLPVRGEAASHADLVPPSDDQQQRLSPNPPPLVFISSVSTDALSEAAGSAHAESVRPGRADPAATPTQSPTTSGRFCPDYTG